MPRKLESQFQHDLIKDLESLFPDCIILKGNSAYRQGIPDWIVLWRSRWAMLEVKRGAYEVHQPNQDWYVERLNDWSFAAFVFPENRDEVLDELVRAFGDGG